MGRKSRPTFALFDICKIMVGMGETSLWLSQLEPITYLLIYFGGDPFGELGHNVFGSEVVKHSSIF